MLWPKSSTRTLPFVQIGHPAAAISINCFMFSPVASAAMKPAFLFSVVSGWMRRQCNTPPWQGVRLVQAGETHNEESPAKERMMAKGKGQKRPGLDRRPTNITPPTLQEGAEVKLQEVGRRRGLQSGGCCSRGGRGRPCRQITEPSTPGSAGPARPARPSDQGACPVVPPALRGAPALGGREMVRLIAPAPAGRGEQVMGFCSDDEYRCSARFAPNSGGC